jgi:hypothetical protein
VTLPDRVQRTQLVWSAVVIAAGVIGLVISRHLPLTDPQGTHTGWPRYELYLMTYNRLGALVTIALGLLGVVAGVTRRPVLAWITCAAFVVLVVQALVQWRQAATDNLLASSGQSLSFALASVFVYSVTAWVGSQASPRSHRPSPSTSPEPT